jgi:hypothetical protein
MPGWGATRHVLPGIVLDGGLARLARRESPSAAAGYEPAALAIA